MSGEALVWVDPARMSGDPCVMGSRVTTAAVALYCWSYDVHEALTAYPHLTREQVLGACWYEATHGNRRWRKRWGEWARSAQSGMWHRDYAAVPDPPRKDDDA